ncbi:MAG: creatininase family protein [Burkholderiaceae bacterium]|jgi:creatinine amidohydrolase|nr:creatininase family protein [Burkholderiaceae bacterium]
MHSPLPRFWAELNTLDFAALDPVRTVAVLPLGAIEQHGPHLPLGVDSVLAEGIVRAVAARLPADLPALFLPTLPVGHSPEHVHYPGTLTLSGETLLRLCQEIGAGVARAGVRKLVLLSTHGGHTGLMDIAARELRMAHGLIVVSTSWFNLPLGDLAPARFDVHAGQSETALMLALAPAQVRMDRAADFVSTGRERAARYPILGNGRSAKLGWAMQDLNPAGAAGNAAAADAVQGHALLDAVACQFALLLDEVARLPLETAAPGPLK